VQLATTALLQPELVAPYAPQSVQLDTQPTSLVQTCAS